MPPTPPANPDPGNDDIARLTFEQAVEQLEEIIDRIESGKIGLEESMQAYERGRRLNDHARSILARAEQRVVELTPDEQGRA